MYYDLLLFNGLDKWRAYGRIDTFSQVVYIYEYAKKSYFSFVFVRRVSSYGADSWKFINNKSSTYSKLNSVNYIKNLSLCSKFKEIIRGKICRIAETKKL